MRKFLCAGNWKLNKSPLETISFFEEFLTKVSESESQSHFVFFPPAINLVSANEMLKSTNVGWGAQNVCAQVDGAFTGENSAHVVAQLGAQYCLLGHSERRHIFSESNSIVCEKFKTILNENMIPMLCVGETLEQREAGKTEEVVSEQLKSAILGSEESLTQKEFVLAYEPVWAIGTGKVASPEQAEEVHKALRKSLGELVSEEVAQSTSILYGGSVKPDNAQELAKKPNIDGFLVGGASLKVESIASIFFNAYKN